MAGTSITGGMGRLGAGGQVTGGLGCAAAGVVQDGPVLVLEQRRAFARGLARSA